MKSVGVEGRRYLVNIRGTVWLLNIPQKRVRWQVGTRSETKEIREVLLEKKMVSRFRKLSVHRVNVRTERDRIFEIGETKWTR